MPTELPTLLPKHQTIASSLRSRIKTGEFSDRLPSRDELARLFNANFKTVGKAIGSLAKERVVQFRPGLGVFVHPALKGRTVKECFFVFPGHKAITDPANPSRHLLLFTLEQMLSAGHELDVELRLLPISPLNDSQINWTLLAHLKKDDHIVFHGGLQYWDVIRELDQRGCRCFVLSDTPAGNNLDAAGMSLMSFDIDYHDMLRVFADYLSQNGCRRLAVSVITPWRNRGFWTPLFNELSGLCGQKGVDFSPEGVIEMPECHDQLPKFLDKALRQKHAVDAIFTFTEAEGRQVREILNRRSPSVRRSIRVISFDNDHTWESNALGLDALRKPQGEMIGHVMSVISGKAPFEPKSVLFPARLERADQSALRHSAKRNSMDG